MPLPSILLGILISSAFGAGFHLWRGGSLRRLVLYLVLAWAGFWAGDTAGWLLGWDFWAVGLLNVGMGTVGALVFLLVGEFVSHIRVRR